MLSPTTSLYAFIEKQSEILLARTADTKELIKIKQQNWIALNELILLNNKTYKIVNIVIDPFDTESRFIPEHDFDLGETSIYNVEIRIYVSPPNS
jgi:hypothetical protein